METHVPTTSSQAEADKIATQLYSSIQYLFQVLGSGTFGKVYTKMGSDLVWKKARNVVNGSANLLNDAQQLARIREKMPTDVDVFVPGVLGFYGENAPHTTDFFVKNAARFPEDDRRISTVVCMERVMPIHKPLKNTIIETFCPENLVGNLKDSARSQSCILRVLMAVGYQLDLLP